MESEQFHDYTIWVRNGIVVKAVCRTTWGLLAVNAYKLQENGFFEKQNNVSLELLKQGLLDGSWVLG